MKSPEDATLLDVIIDGCEGGQGAMETLNGWRTRKLPLPSEEAAVSKFDELRAEIQRWKGPSVSAGRAARLGGPSVAFAEWGDIRIAQARRGIVVMVLDPRFDRWWHDDGVWGDDGDAKGTVDEVLEWAWHKNSWGRPSRKKGGGNP